MRTLILSLAGIALVDGDLAPLDCNLPTQRVATLSDLDNQTGRMAMDIRMRLTVI
jgi:hypothetical protein